MNYENLINQVGRRLEQLESDVASAARSFKFLKVRYEESKIFTSNFLDKCKARGITKVAICMSDKSVPASISHPFSADGSVFAFQPKRVRKAMDTVPIWGAVEDAGISGGCGNPDQHQLNSEGEEGLIDGIYHLRKGTWQKVR